MSLLASPKDQIDDGREIIMKKLTVFLILALLLVGVSAAWAASVEPEARTNINYGDAAHYCVTTLGYDWGLKIEAWGGPGGERDMNGTYSGAYDSKGKLHEDFENVITLSKATRYTFDWESDPYAIDAVVVQGGWMDNIFFYDPAVKSDTELYPYDSGTKKKETISHISFCWNKTDDNGDDECYQDETAWAVGLPYVEQGNWAMYVPYYGKELTVALLAGKYMDAGTVTFSAPVEGMVTITINLDNDFIFYYDVLDTEEDDNLKVQDYEVDPSENPAPGLFAWKKLIPFGSTTGSITVPQNNYYGVHLDLAQLVPCE
jgi:hypothetical protein